ncbi:hypothetical protein M413DRAFT_272276 [Hebeloma cylindrosporum]|uniref:Uncharacterized protein n=1 Tax=Hebeloma cylindrosporum TaxID=76867 RepID=A0A0C3CTU1_HEBCY|nr:hypothetical protein M413DRAFT_272276 [Hebeloma cylindrosporum h7]
MTTYGTWDQIRECGILYGQDFILDFIPGCIERYSANDFPPSNLLELLGHTSRFWESPFSRRIHPFLKPETRRRHGWAHDCNITTRAPAGPSQPPLYSNAKVIQGLWKVHLSNGFSDRLVGQPEFINNLCVHSFVSAFPDH